MNPMQGNNELVRSFLENGNLNRAQGKVDQAMASFEKALQLDPCCMEVLLQLAILKQQRSSFDKAIEYCERILRIKPDLATPYFLLANLYQQQGNEAKAIPMLLKGAELEPKAIPAQLHVDLAKYLSAQNRLSEAAAGCQRALSIDPRLVAAHELSADLCWRQGKLDEAIRSLQRLLETHPALGSFSNAEHVDYSFPSRIWELTKQLNDLRDELDGCPNPPSTTPAAAWNLWLTATALAGMGKLDLADEKFQNSIQAEPQFAEAYYSLGIVLANLGASPWQPAKLQKAIECFQKVIQIRPDWADAHFRLGKACEKLLVTGCENQSSDLSPAVTCFQKTISLKPEHTEAYRELGILDGRSGRLLESWNWLKKYYRHVTEEAVTHSLGKMGVRFLDPNNAYAIGHLAQVPECYLKLQQLGWLPRYQTIFLAPAGRVANPSLLNYWRKHLEVVTDSRRIQELWPVAKKLSHPAFFVVLPDGRGMHISPAMSVVQKEWENRGLGPLLTLSDADRERGWKCLQEMGVPKGAWFVSLHVREGGFKREGDGPYNRHRNANIETYVKAVDAIVARGGWVVRMGEPSMRPIPARPQLVDYAHSKFKSDWMELFLCSQCRFFLCSGGGIFATPQLFGVPVAGTNWPPTIPSHRTQDIIIPKLIRQRREGRYLTFQEMLSPPIIHNANGIFLSQLGLEFVDNSAEEISELAVEMLDRVSGALTYSSEEQPLQQRFASLVAPDFGVFTSRIGREFLTRYSNFLG